MKVGDTYEVKKTVTEDMTAEALGSGGLRVFGTPYLAAMMENAAYSYLQEHLPEGKSSVGTRIESTHVSPTPIGMAVTAKAEVIAISEDQRRIDFKVSAYDDVGLIGEGLHQRAVIDVDRFMSKCQSKLNSK